MPELPPRSGKPCPKSLESITGGDPVDAIIDAYRRGNAEGYREGLGRAVARLRALGHDELAGEIAALLEGEDHPV